MRISDWSSDVCSSDLTILNQFLGVQLPPWLAAAPLALGGAPGGFINLPAVAIELLITCLLMIGTTASARVNALLVLIKVAALSAFVALTFLSSDFASSNFHPFLPARLFAWFAAAPLQVVA